jgi:hypothetical protein
VRVDSLALQMRPRSPHEAADLGVRLCQFAAREVYPCWFAVAIPLAVISASLFEIAMWLPAFFMWVAKPWLDRTVLFVLSRAAFGQRTTLRDLWDEQRDVWWRQLLITWTWRRLSPWRALTAPVYQLEGHGYFQLRPRVSQIRRRYSGAAWAMSTAFAFAETALVLGFLSLGFWFAPPEQDFDLFRIYSENGSQFLQILVTSSYLLAVLFLEPFYVAAGFGMYLNRRAELEAWDIEQEFRRAFAA